MYAPLRSYDSPFQVKEEGFLEDINNILQSGEVPNLYAKDELPGIHGAMHFTTREYLVCNGHGSHGCLYVV